MGSRTHNKRSPPRYALITARKLACRSVAPRSIFRVDNVYARLSVVDSGSSTPRVRFAHAVFDQDYVRHAHAFRAKLLFVFADYPQTLGP